MFGGEERLFVGGRSGECEFASRDGFEIKSLTFGEGFILKSPTNGQRANGWMVIGQLAAWLGRGLADGLVVDLCLPYSCETLS